MRLLVYHEIDFRKVYSCLREIGSKPQVGSSKSSTIGYVAIARAMLSFRLVPPERFFARVEPNDEMPKLSFS
jgi:hypothetical protein